MNLKRLLLGAMTATAVWLQTGCASYTPNALSPGATVAEAERDMGPRTAAYPLPGGGQRLEFARGPWGRHTYMLDFDPEGRLLRSEQVLTEARFAELSRGLSRDEVLSRIGHPAAVMRVGHGTFLQTVWSYRYTRNECLWFQVSFDPTWRLVETGYGIDPSCDRLD